MQGINLLTIDATRCRSDLCEAGSKYSTDKSPYSVGTVHRHAYTAAYDLLLSPLKEKAIVFGELGILDNASIKMWRSYLPQAALYGFEFFDERIEKARNDSVANTTYINADVSSVESLRVAFASAGRLFDILIDDSTHLFDHQINFVEAAVDFVCPSGLIIIEDIFRQWDVTRFDVALSHLLHLFDWTSFIDTNHDMAFNQGGLEPYFDNDRILVLRRNNVPRALKPSDAFIKIFMATHKPYHAPEDRCYCALHAGAALGVDFGIDRDDTGDNISVRNPYYSEVTALYWIWKNVTAEIVGLVHYRRLFASRGGGLAYKNVHIASGEELLAAMSDKDMMLVEPLHLQQTNNQGLYSVEGQYVQSHGYDIKTARDVIEDHHNDYLGAFDMVMRGCQLIPYNLIVARKPVFDRYSQWLFDVLFAVEKRVQLASRGPYQQRVLAFLAERMLTVWVAHNWNELRIEFRPHVFVGDI